MGMTQLEMDVARSTLRKNKAIADSLEHIDWERRRYEVAKEILPFAVENDPFDPLRAADLSVRYADALIEKLKKSRTNDEE